MKSIENMPAQQSFDSGNAPAWNWVRWLQSLVAWLYQSGTYTSTVTAGAGAFTTVSAAGRYWKIGSFVFVQITITITTNGNAAASVVATLPFTSVNVAGVRYTLSGHGNVSGKMLRPVTFPNSNQVITTFYDNTYPGADGETLYLSGFYEAAN